MAQPTANLTFRHGTGDSLESIFKNGALFGSAGAPFDAWYIDRKQSLDIGNGYQYQGVLYSSYETNLLASALPQTYVDNLDNINWLLNYYRGGNDPDLTEADVQRSIWELMHQLDTTSTLTRFALSMDGYVPDAGETLVVAVDSIRPNGTHDQTTIIETKAAKLGDRVWHDRNADGIQDAAEKGIAGAKVELVRDINGDGQFTGNEILATTRTDANGNYSFKGLTPGFAYQVRFSPPQGYDAASPRQSDGSKASDNNSDGQLSDVVVLAPCEYNCSVDAGFYKDASLGDRVWNDSNANGIQDAGEAGRRGVQVQLYSVQGGKPGALLATQYTDADGLYRFTQLKPGAYIVKFTAADGTVFTTRDSAATNDGADSDAGTTGFTKIYTLASGQHNLTVDAGLTPICTTPMPDKASVCEDRTVNFNVLANDLGVGLELIKVAHETAALDSTFKSKGGVISFAADGEVTYKSMTNYYGVDKLVYTLQDAQGKQYTQTVDINVTAVSDAPTVVAGQGTYHWDYDGGYQFYGTMDGKTTWIHDYSEKAFGKFSDLADALQDFGGYNKAAGIQDDTDSLKVIRLYGLSQGAQYGTVLFDGQPVDFSNGNTLDVTVEDIKAGRLDLKITKSYTSIKLDWSYVDTGTTKKPDCCDGMVESPKNCTTIWTPIALDLSGDGQIGVTGATSSSQKDADADLGRTVKFDIDADGRLDTIEWFDGSGDGILVDNRDGNAATHMDGSRLFGDAGGAFANGYDKLASLDAGGDGLLSGDELAGLLVWVDDGDALVQVGELRTLADVGVASISTQVSVTVDSEGRGHIESVATRSDGSQLMTEDVYLAQRLPAMNDVLGSADSGLDALVGRASAETANLGASATSMDAHVPDVAQAAELLRKLSAATMASAEAATA